MKLIIDIPEIDYECAKTRWMVGTDPHMMDYYISKGIPLDVMIENMRMKKEDILHYFQDINFYYNDCGMYDDLSRMLDELIAESEEE